MGGQFNFDSGGCCLVHFFVVFAQLASNGRMQPTVCCVGVLHLHKNCIRYEVLSRAFFALRSGSKADIKI